MVKIQRGDIYWADLNPTKGNEQARHRPVLVISNDFFNLRSGTIISMPLTSQAQKAGFPLTFQLNKNHFDKSAWVKISQIRVLSTDRVGKKIGRATPEELNEIIRGLGQIIH